MPRLFTALAVPPEVADVLKAYQGGLHGARWIEPGDFHVTLRFLVDVEATVAEEVVEALAEMRVRPPLTVTLDGLGIDGDGAHTLHEYALVSSIVPRAKLMQKLLETL